MDWPKALENCSHAHGPKLDEVEDDDFKIPEIPTWKDATDTLKAEGNDKPATQDISVTYRALLAEAQFKQNTAMNLKRRNDAVRTWIVKSVKKGIYRSIEESIRKPEGEY